jgi:hypothetical protein
MGLGLRSVFELHHYPSRIDGPTGRSAIDHDMPCLRAVQTSHDAVPIVHGVPLNHRAPIVPAPVALASQRGILRRVLETLARASRGQGFQAAHRITTPGAKPISPGSRRLFASTREAEVQVPLTIARNGKAVRAGPRERRPSAHSVRRDHLARGGGVMDLAGKYLVAWLSPEAIETFLGVLRAGPGARHDHLDRRRPGRR